MRWFFTAVVCSLALSVSAQDLVPFVIPSKVHPESAIQLPSRPIHGPVDRVIARDGHFYRASNRIRFWGVNLSFAANFPTHEDAVRVAERLAAYGVNSVRCHHMDSADWPRGLWDPQQPTKIHPEALDRLDFFINELAKKGIYVNINLHVGRAHSRHLPDVPEANRQYDKIAGIFTPALVEQQKQFAREIVTHYNPYRKHTYGEDAAVAIFEITNEDSFFMWDAESTLRQLPDYYADILRGQFNEWLRKTYGSADRLQSVWNAGAEPLGENLLKQADVSRWGGRMPSPWSIEQHGDAKMAATVDAYKDRPAVHLDIQRIDDTEWHLQFKQADLALKAGQYYTVTFEAAAGSPRSIACAVSMAHEPWSNLGLSRRMELTPEWRTFTIGFAATGADDNARLSFSVGGEDADVYLRNLQLRPGGQVGLTADESLRDGTVSLFVERETMPRRVDRMRFLAETEKQYFDSLRYFIQRDLNSKALVTGTIVFGPLGLYAQSDMDFVDGHAYWQHPRFPNRPWDRSDWLVEQKAMVDHPQEATLFRLACERLKGKPFTVSEYNHPAPLDSQAETVPLIASFGAAQDWDGVWLYTYSHSGDAWDREHLSSFFDIDTNPAKWGFVPAGAVLFRDGGLAPLTTVVHASLARGPEILPDLARRHLEFDRNMLSLVEASGGLSWRNLLDTQVDVMFGTYHRAEKQRSGSQRPTTLRWTAEDGQGGYAAMGDAGWVCVGRPEPAAGLARDVLRFTAPDFAAVAMTSLDGSPLHRSGRLLITACGRAENTGMQFSEDRRTVGANWGTAPVRIEPVQARVVVPDGRWKCNALRADGTIGVEIPVGTDGGQNVVDLSAAYGTMWYLLTKTF